MGGLWTDSSSVFSKVLTRVRMLSKISYNSSVEKKNERVNIESDNSCSDRTLYKMLKFSDEPFL